MKKQYLKSKSFCKVTFSLPKEAVKEASSVLLLGEFNEWEPTKAIELSLSNNGTYETELELPAGTSYEFRYLIDNERWENAWDADGYVPSPFLGVENSVVSLIETFTHLPEKETKSNGSKPKKAEKKAVAESKVEEVMVVEAKMEEAVVEAKAEIKEAEIKTPKGKKTKDTKEDKDVKKSTKSKIKAPKKDDLKAIEGIGPKIATLLQDAGYHTWDKIAQATAEDLKKVLDDAGSKFKMHDPSTWSQQAQLAVDEKWEELKTLQEKLKGGKE